MRNFNGSTDKLEATTAAVTAYPLSFFSVYRPDDSAANKVAVGVGKSGDNNNFAVLMANDLEKPVLFFRLNSGTNRSVTGSTTLSTLTPSRLCGTIDSSRVPRVYVNGVLDGTGTDGGAGTFNALNRTAIGVIKRNSPADDFFMDGDIAEAAIWDRQLDDGKIAALGKGYSPLWFRRGLVFYRDLIRDLNRPYIGPALTATGTTIIAHPPMIYPKAWSLFTPSTGFGDGAGSSSGVGAASGVGASIAAALGLAEGLGAASGISPSTGAIAGSRLNPTLN